MPFATVVGLAVSVTVGTGGSTVTAAFALAVPPGPVQLKVNVVVPGAARAPLVALPLVALLPFHPPLAVQLVAFVEFQASCVEAPLATLAGDAVSVTVGSGVTVTVALVLFEPPTPLQLSVKVVSAVSAALAALPLTPLEPVQPPEAVQAVALAELQVSCVV
ncbi:MAG: hypothetical protein U1F11_12350 [Steroidobacteraceae bacterium]